MPLITYKKKTNTNLQNIFNVWVSTVGLVFTHHSRKNMYTEPWFHQKGLARFDTLNSFNKCKNQTNRTILNMWNLKKLRMLALRRLYCESVSAKGSILLPLACIGDCPPCTPSKCEVAWWWWMFIVNVLALIVFPVKKLLKSCCLNLPSFPVWSRDSFWSGGEDEGKSVEDVVVWVWVFEAPVGNSSRSLFDNMFEIDFCWTSLSLE